MFRAACAALATTLALLAWPAFAEEDEDAGTTEEAAEEETEEEGDEAAGDEEEDEVDYHRRGLYAGLAGTWAVEKFQDSDDIDTEDSGGVNARVGYHALSWLSVEAQAEYLPKFDIDFGANSGDLAIWLAGANLRLSLPTDLIQPYALLGGGYIGAHLSGAGTGGRDYDGHSGFGRAGGGVEFYFWPFLALDLGLTYVIPAGDVQDLDFLSIHWGALYRF
jgi:hypothetical protein